MNFERYFSCINQLEFNQPKGILYHYANLEGLKGILKTCQLWMSERKILNDTSEVKHAIDIIENVISEDLGKNNSKSVFGICFFDE